MGSVGAAGVENMKSSSPVEEGPVPVHREGRNKKRK